MDPDASGRVIGAVLSQVQNAEERIVSYGSRLYSKAEEHYCTTRNELLAIVYFVKYFKQYLLGRRFRIQTDHAALQWLMKTPEPIGQRSRWVEQSAAFDFEVIHRPGVRHQNADSISRILCRQCDWEADDVEVVAPVKEEGPVDLSPAAMKDLQSKDPDIIEFKELMQNYSDRRPTWHELDGLSEETKIMWSVWSEFEVVNDILYRRSVSPVTKDIDLRLVIPKAVRRQVFHLIHGDMTGGHLGVVRTREQLRRRVYWPWLFKGCRLVCKSMRTLCTIPSRQGSNTGNAASHAGRFCLGDDWNRLDGTSSAEFQRFKYILTVVNHFSKFDSAFPLRNMEAATIARVLVDGVICLVGAPYRILRDQGPNFEGQLFKELCKTLGIAKIRTSPYKPSTNGITERFHQTLNSMIAKCVKESQRDWDLKLPMVLAAYRASCHSATSLTPNRIVFGREKHSAGGFSSVRCRQATREGEQRRGAGG